MKLVRVIHNDVLLKRVSTLIHLLPNNSVYASFFFHAFYIYLISICMTFLFLPCVSTVIIVYIIIISPLNSYLYIHWILEFK